MKYSSLQELYSDKTRWAHKKAAIHDNGKAVSWCLFVGCSVVYGSEYLKYFEVIDKIQKRVEHIVRWNDRPWRTVEDVQKLVKELNI